MSTEEKPVKKQEEAVSDAPKVVSTDEMKKPDLHEKPTAKDAGRFLVMMITLFMSIIFMIMSASIAFSSRQDNLETLIGAFFVSLPTFFAVALSLPSIIIGAIHRREKDTYKLFMILGIIAAVAAVVCSFVGVLNGALLFKR